MLIIILSICNCRVIQEHIGAKPASVLLTRSVGILPVETCQAAEAAIPELHQIPLELLTRNERSMVLKALFLRKINLRRKIHSNIHVRYLFFYNNLY